MTRYTAASSALAHVMDHTPRFLALVEQIRAQVRECSPADVQALLASNGARVFDVREDHEWNAGHVRGAEHVGKGIIERDIERLVPDTATSIVLYCGGGFRSALATDALQRMGYTNVQSMAGGWRAWNEVGGAVAVPER
jgi:rhodanese-related sulfurtransferase